MYLVVVSITANIKPEFDVYHRNSIGASLLFTLLVFSLFVYVGATDAETSSLERVLHVGTEAELRDAVNGAARGMPVVIIFDKHIDLTETTLTIPPGADVTLRSDSELVRNSGVEFFRLYGVSDLSTITIEEGGLLKLEGIIVTHNEGAYGSGVEVNSDGTLFMTGGIVSGNTADVGGGISNRGIFSLSGGIISGNTAETGGGVANRYSTASFAMFDGEISDNTARKSGGGVYNSFGGAFNLFGGLISGNIADWGGGVNNWGSYFTMFDGEISYNIATNTVSGGGGVAFDGSRFDMLGGAITGNRAPNGGGMYTNNGMVQFYGGVISDNVASESGGGIYAKFLEVLYVSDGVVFYNNQASLAYDRDPIHDRMYQDQIGANVVWTFPFSQGYNNYDISYISEIPIQLNTSPNNQSSPNSRIAIYAIALLALIICIAVVVLNFYFKK